MSTSCRGSAATIGAAPERAAQSDVMSSIHRLLAGLTAVGGESLPQLCWTTRSTISPEPRPLSWIWIGWPPRTGCVASKRVLAASSHSLFSVPYQIVTTIGARAGPATSGSGA